MIFCAVLGDPISHSLSPRMHNLWFQREGIDGCMIPVRSSVELLASNLEALQRLGFKGANVTLPLKEKAFQLSDVRSDASMVCGAANLVCFQNQQITADNTDGYGFTWNIRHTVPGWMPRQAAVIGAGGAARAILAALIETGAEKILVTNRTRERISQLPSALLSSIEIVDWQYRDEMLQDCDVLVNTTSLGMVGNPALPLRLDALPKSAVVNDIVYKPLETPLLKAARERGNIVVDGFGMLLHQAVPAFRAWTGVTPTIDQRFREMVLSS